MTKYKPRLFVASSSESLDIAYAVQESLESSAQITVWSQGVFELSGTVIETLFNALDKFDCSVFIFSPTDVAKIRDQTFLVTRDNVIFELGLFIGRLGRNRNFVIMPRGYDEFHIPSDLLGVLIGTYDPKRAEENLLAAIGPVCNQIRRSIEKIPNAVELPGSDSATKRLTEETDPLFTTLAKNTLERNFNLVARGRVEHQISKEADLLRNSIDIQAGTIRATYFVDDLIHLKFWTGRRMESYLDYNKRIALRQGVSFKRIFVIQDAILQSQHDIDLLTEVLSNNEKANITTKFLFAHSMFGPAKPSKDTVIVNDERLHIHAVKHFSESPYSTSTFVVDKSAIAQAQVEWERLYNDALSWPEDQGKLTRYVVNA